MKKDLTQSIMERVIGWEKRRILVWFLWFGGILAFLGTLLLAVSWWTVGEVRERQTLELFSLFGEDREIILEYWTEVLSTFWEESPQSLVMFLGIIIFGLLAWWFVTRRTRGIVRRKLKHLATYRKSSNMEIGKDETS